MLSSFIMCPPAYLSCFGRLSSTRFSAKKGVFSDPDEMRAVKMFCFCPEDDMFCHHLEDVPRPREVEWITCWLTPLNQKTHMGSSKGPRGPFSLKTGCQTISGWPLFHIQSNQIQSSAIF